MTLFASAVGALCTIVLAIIPSAALPGGAPPDDPSYPAPPGYLLPWAGGTIRSVTQGEETSFTHNGLAAYAFDFDLNYDTVVAARSGKVLAVYDGSNSGGCDPSFAAASNYVLIDHGDGTSALYLHLAYASATVAVGDIVDRGQPIAISGETGVTCNDVDGGPAPHLHFQVQRTEDGGGYFAQSLPVAFDDVRSGEGVPVEGESYVSGNYGRGKEQKIRLTPYRVPRVFAPKATPADPTLVEAHPPAATETPLAGGASDVPAALASETPTPEPTETETATPKPTWTETPVPTSTVPHTETPTPSPLPTDTASAATSTAPAEPTPEPSTATPSGADAPTEPPGTPGP